MHSINKKNIAKFIALPLAILGVFFIFKNIGKAETKPLIISEIMYNPDGADTGREWIELYNPNDLSIVIEKSAFGLVDDASEKSTCHTMTNGGPVEIDSKEYIVIADNAEKFQTENPNYKGVVIDSTLALLNTSGAVKISLDRCKTWFDEVLYEKAWGGYENGRTIEKKVLLVENNSSNWQESFVLGGTPGEKLSEKPIGEVDVCLRDIVLSEIYPFSEEFVEIENVGKTSCTLGGWKISDEAKHQKIFENSKIEPGSFAYIFGNLYLNDDGDIVSLLDSSGKIVDTRVFEKKSAGFSYAKFTDGWEWTAVPTRGSENLRSADLKMTTGIFKISRDENIYVDTYAYFSVENLSDNDKVTWDFGDGHKSYLKNTKHKFEKIGKYTVSLKVTEEGQSNLESFEITVEDYPHPKVRISEINANPMGSDENETITVENMSKKKINLKGWTVATGSKNMTNHSIGSDIIIKKGKTEIVTRDDSKFTLNNKEGKVELKYPDGKVAAKVKYKKEKGIEEGEVYVKVKGGWAWKQSQKSVKPVKKKDENLNSETIGISNQEGEVQESVNVLDDQIATSDSEKLLKENQKDRVGIFLPEKFGITENSVENNLNSKVLGILTEKKWKVYDLGDRYVFTFSQIKEKHYSRIFLSDIISFMNEKINSILN